MRHFRGQANFDPLEQALLHRTDLLYCTRSFDPTYALYDVQEPIDARVHVD